MTIPMAGVVSRINGVILLLFVVGLVSMISIYNGIREQDDLAGLDQPVLDFIISHQIPALTSIMAVITDILSPISIGIFSLLIASVWFWKTKERWRPFLLIIGMSLAFGVTSLIKMATERQRPTITDILQSPAVSYSFPSGHTVGVATLILILGYLAYKHHPSLKTVYIWGLAFITLVSLVAFSRLYLGYHWLTDVSASIGLSFIVLAIIITIDTYLPIRKKKAISEALSNTSQ